MTREFDDFTDRVRRHFGMGDADEAKIVGAIRRNLGVTDVVDVLGTGSFGIAAALDKNRVIKITRDPTEIATSHRIVGRDFRHVVRIDGVWLIGGLAYSKGPAGHPVAAIIMERMTGTGTRDESANIVLTEEMMLARSGHPGKDLASLERRSWDQMLAMRVASEESPVLARLAQVADGIEEMRNEQIYLGDVHHKNVGWKMVDGKLLLKIFDLGISSILPTTEGRPPTIEEQSDYGVVAYGAEEEAPNAFPLRSWLENKTTTYEYGAALRPPTHATVPQDGWTGTRSSPVFKHGVVQYSRPLSKSEVAGYELIPLDPWYPGQPAKGFAVYLQTLIEEFTTKNIVTADVTTMNKISLTNSTRPGVNFQVTSFVVDRSGRLTPVGHRDYNDFTDAAKEFWGALPRERQDTIIRRAVGTEGA